MNSSSSSSTSIGSYGGSAFESSQKSSSASEGEGSRIDSSSLWSALLSVSGKVAVLVLVNRGVVDNVAAVVAATVVIGTHVDCSVLDVIVASAAFLLLYG